MIPSERSTRQASQGFLRHELTLILLALVRHPRELGWICLAWATPVLLLVLLLPPRWEIGCVLAMSGLVAALGLARRIGQALNTAESKDWTSVWRVYVNGAYRQAWGASEASRLQLSVWLDPMNHLGQVFQGVNSLVRWAVSAVYRLGSLAALFLFVSLAVAPHDVVQVASNLAQAPAGTGSPWMVTAGVFLLMADFMCWYALAPKTWASWTSVFINAREQALRAAIGLASVASVDILTCDMTSEVAP